MATPAVVAEPPPTPAARDGAVVPLSVLHHVAQREIALNRQAEDLDRLSVLRGVDFDRQFWVTVARDHRAASELLASPTRTVPSLHTVVDETARLIRRSIRDAAAAQAATNAPRPH